MSHTFVIVCKSHIRCCLWQYSSSSAVVEVACAGVGVVCAGVGVVCAELWPLVVSESDGHKFEFRIHPDHYPWFVCTKVFKAMLNPTYFHIETITGTAKQMLLITWHGLVRYLHPE